MSQCTYIQVLTLLFSSNYQWPIEKRCVLVEYLTWLVPVLGEKILKPFENLLLTTVKKDRKKKTPPPILLSFNPNNLEFYMRVGIHLGNNNIKEIIVQPTVCW